MARHRRRHHRNRPKPWIKRLPRSPWAWFGLIVGLALVLDVILLFFQFGGGRWIISEPLPPAQEAATPTPGSSALPVVTESPTPVPSATPLPEKALLTVPFTSQAPFGVWDALHEDACEEASLLMVRHFLAGTQPGTPDDADRQIKELVATGERIGQGPSITAVQLGDLAVEAYGMKPPRVVSGSDVTVEALKRELAAGHPVVVPAAGKLLPNPNFSNGGPNYHMLVLIGYDAEGFISNDPGTRQGKDFRYSFDALSAAIHDWDPADILHGQRTYLVFE